MAQVAGDGHMGMIQVGEADIPLPLSPRARSARLGDDVVRDWLGQLDGVGILGCGQEEHLVLLAHLAGAVAEESLDDFAEPSVGFRTGFAGRDLLLGEGDRVIPLPDATNGAIRPHIPRRAAGPPVSLLGW